MLANRAKCLLSQVKETEADAAQCHKDLEDTKLKVEHWQKRFNEKNTEAEQQASQQIEVSLVITGNCWELFKYLEKVAFYDNNIKMYL